MEQKSSRIIIIDPTSTEFNRGSFCYLPYIVFSYYKDYCDAELWEDFTAAQIDNIPPEDEVLVALWSYPQVDLCKTIYRFSASRKIKFFGYTPLVKWAGLPLKVFTPARIKQGIVSYANYVSLGAFYHILLSDCDMHLNKYDGIVYPLFSSYGCPRKCTFCPSCVASEHRRLCIHLDDVEIMLSTMYNRGIRNIHFTDEDFFMIHKRTHEVLKIAKRIGDFNFIALAHLDTLKKFVEEYGPECLKEFGVRLVELGFETADPALAKSMKKGKSLQEYIDVYTAVKDYTDIFWLCLTFFPGETITTLNETGKFLREYGSKPEDLYDRIKTNSTEGGLGQFFQPYPGTPGFEDLPSLGHQIEDRPVRLMPSFLPDSFLNDEIEWAYKDGFRSTIPDKVWEWTEVYNLPTGKIIKFLAWVPQNVRQAILDAKNNCHLSAGEAATFIAILARLGIIKSGRRS